MHRIRITCLAVVLTAGTACAGVDNAGTTSGNFLSVGTGASVLAMGGATLGAGEDLHAVAWNPAALGRLGTTQFTLSHATLATLSAQDLAAAGGRMGGGDTRWGASVLYQGDGSFDGRDALGVPTGTFNVSSMAVGVQVARPLGNVATAGLGARWLSDNLGDARGSGMAFDLGLQARTGPLGLGVAARNVGGSLAYPSGRFDLPEVFGVGASWSDAAHGLRLALDANFPRAYYNDVRIGGEWRWQERVALRAGYRMELGAAVGEPLGGPSFGMGAGTNGVWMDYAFLAGNADAQGQHRFALTFHPGILGGKMRPVAEARVSEVRGSEVDATPGVNAIVPFDIEVLVTEVAPAEAAAPRHKGRNVAPSPAAPEQEATPNSTEGAQGAGAPATPAPAVATPVAPAPRTLSMLEQLAFDVSDRLPAGGSESESAPREIIPLHILAASSPVRVAPLTIGRVTGSNTDARDDEAPVAAQPKAAPPVVVRSAATRTAIARSAAPRPAIAAPAVAPPASARVTFIRPAGASSSAAPVVVSRPAAAPRVVAPLVVAPPAAAPRVVAPVAVAPPAAAPRLVAPVVVAPPAAAPRVEARAVVALPAAASRIVAPVVVAPPAVAPRVVAPVAVASPVVVPAPVALAAPPALAANHPVRPARAPSVAPAPKLEAPAVTTPVVAPAPKLEAPAVTTPVVAPAPKLEAPAVTTPVAAPEPQAAPAAAPEPSAPEPSAPESVPAAPALTPEPAKPVKTSPWPSIAAAMPKAQFAGSSQKVAVIAVPADAPSTAPITRPAATIRRPPFVHTKGDETLADIAKRWDTSVPALMMENNLVNSTVKSGQKLVLPPPLH